MWGINLIHEASVSFNPKQRGETISKIKSVLMNGKFKNIDTSSYLISAEKSPPFKLTFFGGLHHTAYYTFALTEEGKLTAACKVPKGPFTDWGFCKKEIDLLLDSIVNMK